MEQKQIELCLRYMPHIYRDKAEPFPIRYIGCTAFTQARRSDSFPKWYIDPAAENAEMIIEYAIYYDYDIQHLYDLEHIWVAVSAGGAVKDCWCSFHGMRLRAAGLRAFRMEDGTHPVLYAQPGKHAMLPDPELFELHPQFRIACGAAAGGGLLVPDMLADKLQTDPQTDEAVRRYICDNFTFVPTMEFVLETVKPEQLITWQELREKIPQLVEQQLRNISK